MPKMTVKDIVRKLAEVVIAYQTAANNSDRTKRLEKALRNIGEILGEESVMGRTGANFVDAADVLKEDTAGLLDLSVEANNLVKKVKGYVEDELLDADDLDIATKTLETWESVRGGAKSPATGTRRDGERLAQPDFNFAVFSKCELCGEEVKTGERSNRTDWNSLRHYSQKHAIDAHGSQGFRGLVSDSWREAKQAIANGMVEVETDSSTDTPSFTLTAQV